MNRSPGTLRKLAYGLYARKLRSELTGAQLPEHIGLIMDGNRRWARRMGIANPSIGHRYGAEHVEDVLRWGERVGISHVSVFVCSTENLQRRGDAEVAFLMGVIEQAVSGRLGRADSGWQVHVVGILDILPMSTAHALKNAVEQTRNCVTGAHVTLAVGYGGRQELVHAVRSLIEARAALGDSVAEVAETLSVEEIARYLYTSGQPDPDLVVRTSGEQRLSNFLPWQSAHSELQFCEAYWPAFREIDFLRALRHYAAARRRRSES